jgi:hypothetical protein
VNFHKPGQALGVACLKAHAGLSAVKNEKEHTLTASLTSHSEVYVPFGFLNS